MKKKIHYWGLKKLIIGIRHFNMDLNLSIKDEAETFKIMNE